MKFKWQMDLKLTPKQWVLPFMCNKSNFNLKFNFSIPTGIDHFLETITLTNIKLSFTIFYNNKADNSEFFNR